METCITCKKVIYGSHKHPLTHFSHYSLCAQDMETCICRQTLAGHKDDVLALSGLLPPSAFALDASCAAASQAHGSAGHSAAKAAPLEVAPAPASKHIIMVSCHRSRPRAACKSRDSIVCCAAFELVLVTRRGLLLSSTYLSLYRAQACM